MVEVNFRSVVVLKDNIIVKFMNFLSKIFFSLIIVGSLLFVKHTFFPQKNDFWDVFVGDIFNKNIFLNNITKKDGGVEIKKQVKNVNPCQKTIYYSLGDIDLRYNLSSKQILSLLQKAENIWEKEVDYNLFEYKPGSVFKVNFIFDERQQRTLALQALNTTLSSLKNEQKQLSEKFTSKNKKYEKRIEKYKKEMEDLTDDLASYNKEVSYWNKQGGAPPNKYAELEKTLKKLQKRQEDLEKERKKINDLVNKINKTIQKEKNIVEKYNTEVVTYHNKFGSTREFEQGKYFGDKIDIYEFKNYSDLLLTLTHEFGHALGLKHVDDPKAIMYYLMDQQDLNNIHLTEADKKALNNLCHKGTVSK